MEVTPLEYIGAALGALMLFPALRAGVELLLWVSAQG
jgi:hypothetical protein